VDISKVVFPIFNLRNIERIYEEDGIVYVQSAYQTTILDNTNLAGDTLGERRLRITEPVYTLGVCIHDLAELITCTNLKSKLFIDSTGNYFKYKKKICAKVKYHKVTKQYKTDKGLVVYVHDSNIPRLIKARHAPEYVALAHITGNVSFIYELSETKKEGRGILI